MSQTSYSIDAAKAFPGMLADAPNEADILSRSLEEASEIPFGVGLKAGTDAATQVLLPAAGGDALFGVAAHRHNRDLSLVSGTDAGVEPDGMLNCLQKGRVWVLVEEAVANGDSVFMRHTVNGPNDQPGAFRADNDGGNASDQSAGAQWLDYVAIAGLPHGATGIGLLDLNLPA